MSLEPCKVTKLTKLFQVLSWSFTTAGGEKDMQGQLERFDRAVAIYEQKNATQIEVRFEDATKIGIVIKGMDQGVLREHLLLSSEDAEDYGNFGATLDKMIRARAVMAGTAVLMDIGDFGKGGKGKKGGKDKQGAGKGGKTAKDAGKKGENKVKFDGNCRHCGKYGHKEAECWKKQKSGKTGSGPEGAGGNKKGQGKGTKIGELAVDNPQLTWERQAMLPPARCCLPCLNVPCSTMSARTPRTECCSDLWIQVHV
eukprot:6475803-Amphidinium_carterae.2